MPHKQAITDKPSKGESSGLAPVSIYEVYPLAVFVARTGLDKWALRMARRNGLVVTTVGRRRFVSGRSFMDYLTKIEGQNPPTDSESVDSSHH